MKWRRRVGRQSRTDAQDWWHRSTSLALGRRRPTIQYSSSSRTAAAAAAPSISWPHTHTHTGGRAPQSPIPSPSTHCRSQQVAEYGHCPSTRLAVVERTRTNQHRSNRIRRWPSINCRSPARLRYNALLYIAPTFCRFIAMPVNIDICMQPPCSQAVSDSRSTNTY